MAKTHPDTALKILQLLLRCGMVCQEELNVVLEMMPAVSGGAMKECIGAIVGSAATQRRETPKPQPRQNTASLIDNIRARG
jgi:hypothetical protein